MPTRRLSARVKTNVRTLRREMTDAEARLWYALRRHGMASLKFRRQHPFGRYILDFYCPEGRLVIEIDGGQHFEAENASRDESRTRFLETHGLRVMRFTNLEVLNETGSVLDSILLALRGSEDPSP